MCRKKTPSNKMWINFKNFLEEDYYDLREIHHINAKQTGFNGFSVKIKMQGEISDALDSLAMDKIVEKMCYPRWTSP